uniref:Structural protein n=1 Tax=Electric ant polycipivirus 1 TaxID=3003605 RepID=A0AA95J1J1_9VIRU|nr:structural protein [Electric ant polycipivirus 1]
MTTTESFMPTPPRGIGTPQAPVPQTVTGILSDSGFPSDPENITDFGPDFGWMTAVETFIDSFSITASDTKYVKTLYPACKFPSPTPTSGDLGMLSWHWLPFTMSKWWTGPVRLRFMAIKPPRVPGKLLIRYIPDVSANNFGLDKLRRGIKVEWDLGLNSELVLDIPAYNFTAARPTWITRFVGADISTTNAPYTRFRNWVPHLSQIGMGIVSVEIANPIVPGTIFPDSVRILVFHSFPGSQFHVSTDARSMKKHFFQFSKPESMKDPTPYPT